MNNSNHPAKTIHHHMRRMSGRDPHEEGRVATPLELLFDLTFVIAFGLAASEYAHAFAAGHLTTALMGFGFASFAICWAWINFSWFASAYDTDDWIFRVVTMVQMIGVIVLAIGLPRLFLSIEHGEHLDNSIVVLGYVIMRVAMLFQWMRAARQDPARRNVCFAYAANIAVAQVGWVALIFIDMPLAKTLVFTSLLTLLELSGPYFAERRDGGTPWHAHHIAERYALFAIIALGEGVVGTVATLSAVVEAQGWSTGAAMVGVAGMGLTFGMWWIYYMVPAADFLHRHRERSFAWGYLHIFVVAAIVATGAGLHVAAYFIEHKSAVSSLAAVLAVAVPVMLFVTLIYALYAMLSRQIDMIYTWLTLGTLAVAAAAVAAAALQVDMAICLVILSFAPVVTIVGYEIWGHERKARLLHRHQD